MAKQTAQSAITDIQSLFDPKGYEDAFKTWTGVNERFASIAVEAGTRATDIAHATATEAFANVRELAQVRDEPAAYGKAYADFLQKQADLFSRTVKTCATETQKVGTETAEIVSHAGEEVGGKVTANTKSAAKTAKSAADKAA